MSFKTKKLGSSFVKEISLIIRLRNDRIFGIRLFKAVRYKRIVEERQISILEMFDTLEAVERKCKGKQLESAPAP